MKLSPEWKEMLRAEQANADAEVREQEQREQRARKRAKPKGNGQTRPDDHAQSADDEAKLAHLAKLKAFDYERARKSAAEQLGVRASMLDRLVDAKRDELGIGEGDGLQGSAVTFPEPEPWPHPVTGDRLLTDIAEAIRRHVVLADHARDLAALWVVHSYLLDVAFLITPRLAIRSPTRGCGKTTLLDVLARLVRRPLPAANTSPAAIFRVIEQHQPTILIDEADSFLGQNDELRGILNAGHRRGGQVLRVVGESLEPRAFSVYGACAIALIGQLPGTLTDRSIGIDLKRRLAAEPVEPFRADRTDHLDVLARQAARWVQDNAEAVRNADPEMPDGVFNRRADNLRPILAISDAAGGEWPDRARKAAGKSLEGGEADEGSRLELLLADIRDIFDASDHLDRIASATLIERLVAIEPRPWGEYGRTGKPITQNKLARLLAPLGITPEQIKFGPNDGRKGYRLHQFNEAFERFLSPEGGVEPKPRNQCDEIRTSATSQTETGANEVSVSKCEKPNNDGLCFGVSVQKGDNGTKACAQCNGTPDGPSGSAASAKSTSGCIPSASGSIGQTMARISEWNDVWEMACSGRRNPWHALRSQQILCIGCLETADRPRAEAH
jgi:putative DNA primase/helicase